MIAMILASRHLVWLLAAAALAIFSVYISGLIVPEIVRVVVPEMRRAVADIFR